MEKAKKSLVYLVFLNFLNGLGIYLFLTVMQILIYELCQNTRDFSREWFRKRQILFGISVFS
ncbi:MAG: hypothetical protein SOW67_00050 [Fusobacterium necrophorum]|nr:hypothetical protein [Fusobacterium necrophorum]